HQACRWHNERLNGLPLQVYTNLSAGHPQHPVLVEAIARNLRETGLLEITESVIVEDEPHTVTTLEKLKSLVGVTLAIEDFGTGRSSTGYRSSLGQMRLSVNAFICGGSELEVHYVGEPV
ncbi:MAG: hypothetical protein JOZ19_09860, partial [Rubrobacter sp.]|nr:hypothetical protein [Rubrobacter sp.]